MVFFIHGGSFRWGGANDLALRAQGLVAKQDVIVVVANYRLGILGYLGGEAIKEKDGSTGNWGIQDQRMALQWTRRNIEVSTNMLSSSRRLSFEGSPRIVQ